MWHPNKEVIEGIHKLFQTMVNFHSVQTSTFQMKGFEKIGKHLQKFSSDYFANISISAKAVVLDIHRKNRIHAPWNYDVIIRLYDGSLANTCGVKGINLYSLIRQHLKLDGSNMNVSFMHGKNRFFISEKTLKNPDLAGPDPICQPAGLKIKSDGRSYDLIDALKSMAWVRFAFKEDLKADSLNNAVVGASSFRTDYW